MKTKQIFPASITYLYEILRFIQKNALSCGFSLDESDKIILAAEESIVNIIRYGYPDSEGELEIICEESPDKPGIIITIIDRGIPFNPVENISRRKKHKIYGDPLSHGYGMYLVVGMMDKIDYYRDKDRNILYLIRHLPSDN